MKNTIQHLLVAITLFTFSSPTKAQQLDCLSPRAESQANYVAIHPDFGWSELLSVGRDQLEPTGLSQATVETNRPGVSELRVPVSDQNWFPGFEAVSAKLKGPIVHPKLVTVAANPKQLGALQASIRKQEFGQLQFTVRPIAPGRQGISQRSELYLGAALLVHSITIKNERFFFHPTLGLLPIVQGPKFDSRRIDLNELKNSGVTDFRFPKIQTEIRLQLPEAVNNVINTPELIARMNQAQVNEADLQVDYVLVPNDNETPDGAVGLIVGIKFDPN